MSSRRLWKHSWWPLLEAWILYIVLNMQNQANVHSCWTVDWRCCHHCSHSSSCEASGDKSERIALTHNAKGWDSPWQARGALLANLGAVAQVQAPQQLSYLLRVVHMLQTKICAHSSHFEALTIGEKGIWCSGRTRFDFNKLLQGQWGTHNTNLFSAVISKWPAGFD